MIHSPGEIPVPASRASPLWQRALDLLWAPVTARWLYATTALWFAGHAVIWQWAALKRGVPVHTLFNWWDAGHYTEIIRNGYSAERWAFYPLYPYSVRFVARVLGIEEVAFLGALMASCAFLGFAVWMARALQRSDLPEGLVPGTRIGWVFFLFSPASYIFHTHHTEAYFLLLSFGAFYFSGLGRPVLGGIFAAVSAFTRNQGIFVGGTTALLAASKVPTEKGRLAQLKMLLLTGGVSALGVLGFLLFQYLASGNPFAFAAAQDNWSHADSIGSVFRTLWFGNPWQSTNDANLLRYGMFWLGVVGAVLLFRRNKALGLYAAVSLSIHLLQGEFVVAFRFAAVLFPMLFLLGDRLSRAPRLVAVLALLGWAVLHLHTTKQYVMGNWAY